MRRLQNRHQYQDVSLSRSQRWQADSCSGPRAPTSDIVDERNRHVTTSMRNRHVTTSMRSSVEALILYTAVRTGYYACMPHVHVDHMRILIINPNLSRIPIKYAT